VGFTEHDEMYSKMIRENQILREEALKRIKADHMPRMSSLMKLLEELDVKKDYLDTILENYRSQLLKDFQN